MREFLVDKVSDVRQGDRDVGMDIMGSLAATSYQDDNAKGNTQRGTKLTDDEIIGNAFIMFLAGHETTANVLHFTLLELANNPAAQRQMQQDVDAIFGTGDPDTWDYEEATNAMMGSMLAAVMNETLRMMPPVVEVPKVVNPEQGDQTITIDGVKHILPAGMYVGLGVASAARNRRYWPSTKPSRVSGEPTDLNDWVPERWFRPSPKDEQSYTPIEGATAADEYFGGCTGSDSGSDTSTQLFRPVRGSFIPFSDGPRSCLGRRIAQIEIIATLAVIFQRYSIENAVDEWAGEEEVSQMTQREKEELYGKATKRSRETLRQAQSVVTLKLHGGKHVPVRLVKRGQERFVNWIDT